ncbi:MAG: class I SAM-dependent methyltransferase [Sulfuricaulis sp.]|uniref:class I SAM-dependent methyltransferase n=1 Tax=Sulfuricaulis sp. TaxID=2003553 RepID=UPI0034A31436
MSDPTDVKVYRARLYNDYGEVFQSAPERFDTQAAARWGRAYRYYLRALLPESKDARIVDLACGYGRLLYFFREQGYRHITGVDVSPGQVARANEVVCDVVQMNALDFLEDHRGEFDLITGLDLIEHLTKVEVLRFLDGCFAALKPGGRLVLQTPNADSPFGMAIRYGDITHEVCFNPNALARLLAQTGFREIKAREVGPVPWGYSLLSSVRYMVWQVIRAGLLLWNVAETGSGRSWVLTRNFLISGKRGE